MRKPRERRIVAEKGGTVQELDYNAQARSNLQSGDILLFRGNVLFSRVIETVEGGEYSHSAMVLRWTSRAMVLQAEYPRLEAVPTSIAVDAYSGRVDWFRLTEQARAMLDVERFGDLATSLLGRPFAVKDLIQVGLHNAFGFRLPIERDPERDFFCSEYVSHCYRRAGVELVPKREDVWVSPDDIARSPYVEYVATLRWDREARDAALARGFQAPERQVSSHGIG